MTSASVRVWAERFLASFTSRAQHWSMARSLAGFVDGAACKGASTMGVFIAVRFGASAAAFSGVGLRTRTLQAGTMDGRNTRRHVLNNFVA